MLKNLRGRLEFRRFRIHRIAAVPAKVANKIPPSKNFPRGGKRRKTSQNCRKRFPGFSFLTKNKTETAICSFWLKLKSQTEIEHQLRAAKWAVIEAMSITTPFKYSSNVQMLHKRRLLIKKISGCSLLCSSSVWKHSNGVRMKFKEKNAQTRFHYN